MANPVLPGSRTYLLQSIVARRTGRQPRGGGNLRTPKRSLKTVLACCNSRLLISITLQTCEPYSSILSRISIPAILNRTKVKQILGLKCSWSNCLLGTSVCSLAPNLDYVFSNLLFVALASNRNYQLASINAGIVVHSNNSDFMWNYRLSSPLYGLDH